MHWRDDVIRCAGDAVSVTAENTRYKLIDLGTFGGPSSYLAGSNGNNGAVNQVLNNHGTVVGWRDTSTLDPFAPNCFMNFSPDCFLALSFQWQKGVLTDLGVLLGVMPATPSGLATTG